MTTSDCPRCSPTITLNLSQGQRVLEHIGSHILYDLVVIQSIEPLCGLCHRPSQLCQFYLEKGRGANGNLRIDQKTSKRCPVKMNYSYGIAAESTASSPCSNVPIHCPICPKPTPPSGSTSRGFILKKSTKSSILPSMSASGSSPTSRDLK